MRINTNIPSLQAQRRLSETTQAFGRALERLSSGRRINRAADDASGLAISEGLETQVRSLRQAVRNINDAFGLLSTAESTLATQTELVQRMRELALQAANGTIGNTERGYLNEELIQLYAEFDRIAKTSSLNGTNLLDGSFGALQLQTGASARDVIEFDLPTTTTSEVFRTSVTSGTGQFNLAQTIDVAGAAYLEGGAPSVADLNGDGILDFVTRGNNGSNGAQAYVYFGNGDGSFEFDNFYETIGSGGSGNPVLGDFDGDGDIDFAQGTLNSQTLAIFSNDGEGGFTRTDQVSGMGQNRNSPSAADLNGDGRIDFVAVTTVGEAVIILDDGTGNYSVTSTIGGLSDPQSPPAIFDTNNDGHLDLVLGSRLPNGFVGVYLGDGSGAFTLDNTFQGLATDYRDIYTVDLNNDGILDIAAENPNNANVEFFISNNDGSFTYADRQSSSGDLDFKDFTGDGIVDFFAGSNVGGEGTFYQGNGDGTFTEIKTVSLSSANSSKNSIIDDFNGDGFNDVLVTSAAEDINLYIGDGSGNFTLSQSLSFGLGVSPSAGGFTVADLNGDGLPDIIQGSRDADVDPAGYEVFLGESQTVVQQVNMSLTTQEQAQDLLQVFDGALNILNSARAQIGATQSRLDSAVRNNLLAIENLEVAKSQVLDADFVTETVELTRTQILQRAASSVLTQANVNLQIALELLPST